LISPEATVEEIQKAVQNMDLAKSQTFKANCIERAKMFSLEAFEDKIKREVL